MCLTNLSYDWLATVSFSGKVKWTSPVKWYFRPLNSGGNEVFTVKSNINMFIVIERNPKFDR